jgi:DNA-binding response OmpR family regulator
MNPAAIRSDIAEPQTALVVEQDVLVRAAIADYLRSCGYRVLESRNAEEALTILQESAEKIRVLLSGAEDGFRLAGWVKANRSKIKVILVANAERATQAAAGLCDSGPHRKRPYDPQLLLQQIKATQAKSRGG